MTRHLGPRLAYWWIDWKSWSFVIAPLYREEGYEIGGAFGLTVSMPSLHREVDVSVSVLIRNRWHDASWDWPWSKQGRRYR